MATIVKMRKFRGDTLVFPVVLKDKAGTPISLVGATIKFTINSTPPINQNTTGVVITRTDVEGKFTITIPYAVNILAAGRYLMDVEIIFAGGIKTTLFVAELTLVGDQTL